MTIRLMQLRCGDFAKLLQQREEEPKDIMKKSTYDLPLEFQEARELRNGKFLIVENMKVAVTLTKRTNYQRFWDYYYFYITLHSDQTSHHLMDQALFMQSTNSPKSHQKRIHFVLVVLYHKMLYFNNLL